MRISAHLMQRVVPYSPQQEIADVLDTPRQTITDYAENCKTAKSGIQQLASQRVERHEIADVLGVVQPVVSENIENCESAKSDIQRLASQRVERHEIARTPFFAGVVPYSPQRAIVADRAATLPAW